MMLGGTFKNKEFRPVMIEFSSSRFNLSLWSPPYRRRVNQGKNRCSVLDNVFNSFIPIGWVGFILGCDFFQGQLLGSFNALYNTIRVNDKSTSILKPSFFFHIFADEQGSVGHIRDPFFLPWTPPLIELEGLNRNQPCRPIPAGPIYRCKGWLIQMEVNAKFNPLWWSVSKLYATIYL